MLLLAFLISIGTSAFGQLVKEVTLSSETNLAAALGDEAAQVTTLKISGPLSDADFTTMKDEMKMLQVLDMSGVTELPKIYDYENEIIDTYIQGIPYYALRKKSTLRQVIFPSCLECIDGSAFEGCTGLQALDLSGNSNLIKIERSAFSSCYNLKSVNLSGCSSLKKIETDGFGHCTSLQSVNLSNCTSLKKIGNSGFEYCSALQEVDLSNCSQLASIGSNAFSSSNSILKTVRLTGCSALQTIGDEAFRWCYALSDFDFTQLTALSNIGAGAFIGTALAGDITFASSINQLGGSAFSDCKQITAVNFSNSSLTTVSAEAFANCEKLQKADFSGCSSLNTLDVNAFEGSRSLKKIVIDNGFYKSQDGVLYTADMATLILYPSGKEDVSFTIPDGVETIQSGAFVFTFNSTLKELTIPASVTNIQLNAFSSYSSKTIRLLAEQPIRLSEDIGLTGALVYVPKGSLAAYKEAAIWKDYTLLEEGAEGITIHLESAGSLNAKLVEQGIVANTVQELTVTGPMNAADFEAIKQMRVLIKIDLSEALLKDNILPDNSLSCGANEIEGYMRYLQEVVLPNQLIEIGNNSFNYLHNLRKINIPTSVKKIGIYAFYDCYNLQELNLNELTRLETIESGAFSSCSGIKGSVTLPNSIKEIGDYAFRGTKITSIDFSQTTIKNIQNSTFGDCKIAGDIVFPRTLSSIGDYAFDAACASSLKLKHNNMVQLSGFEVFKSIDKATCKVYVPKGLGATYKADTYWSDFGNNIVEFGNIVTATANNANYGTVSGSGAYEEGETVTLQANMINAESFGFGGWYENNLRISTDLTYSFTMDKKDHSIEARFYDIKNLENKELIDDSNKIDGISFTNAANRLTVNGSIPWHLNSFTYYKWANSILYIDSPVSAEKVEVNVNPAGVCDGWYFISMPYDVRISDIVKPSKDSQFVIRQYAGATRASKGMGNSWKQLKEEDVMKANQGYIMKIDGGSPEDVWYAFNSSIDDMNKLFNREAVTTPLAAHASAVTADANWNLVGNPFPCYFSVKQLFDDGLDGTVTVWSDEIQNYEYYTKDDPNAYLSPLSAFFIQHDQATSVTFKPEGRLAEKPSALRSAARQEDGRKVINLLLSNGSLSDKTRIVFNEAASTAYELGKDAAKFSSMNPDAPMLYTLGEGNQQLAINERPMGEGILPLGCYFGQQGEYTLSVQTELTDDLYLYDQQTGACVNLKEEAYRFDAQAGNSADRFELRTALKGTGIEAIEGLKWQVRNGQLQLTGLPAGATVTVADALGRICFAGDAATAEQGIALPESGIYYLTIRTAEGRSFSEAIKR